MRALQLVLFNQRYLSLAEFYSFILAGTDESDAADFESWDRSETTTDSMIRFITTISKGLIEVRTEGSTRVRFIHETVNDFLTRHGRLRSLDSTLAPNVICLSHDRIVECCLHYIRRMLSRLQKHLIDNRTSGFSLVDISPGVLIWVIKYPFLRYGCPKLFYHMNEAHLSGLSQRERLMQLNCDPDVLCVLKTFVYCDNLKAEDMMSQQKQSTLLQIVSSFPYPWLVKLTLDELCTKVNHQGRFFDTALQAACFYGHFEIIKMLVDAGANVNTVGGAWGTALQAACYYAGRNGSLETIEMLLEAGSSINAQGGFFGNALQAACSRGNDKLVELLIKAGASINAQSGYFGTPLQAASHGRARRTVVLFIEAGVNINIQGGTYGTALQAACVEKRQGNLDIVRTLLRAGSNANSQGGRFGNALQAACRFSSQNRSSKLSEMVEALLKGGANVNAQGGRYGSALEVACTPNDQEVVSEKGDELRIQVVHKLIDAGAKVNTTAGEHGGPLKAALRLKPSVRDQIIKMLHHTEAAQTHAQMFKNVDIYQKPTPCSGEEPISRKG